MPCKFYVKRKLLEQMLNLIIGMHAEVFEGKRTN